VRSEYLAAQGVGVGDGVVASGGGDVDAVDGGGVVLEGGAEEVGAAEQRPIFPGAFVVAISLGNNSPAGADLAAAR
jgi:hypothetical protein